MDTIPTTPAAALPPAQAASLAARLTATAEAAMRRRRPAEALPALDRLRVLPGEEGEAEAMRAEALLQLSRFEEADVAAAASLLCAPQSSPRLQLRARAQLGRGLRREGIASAAGAVMADPADPSAKALLGLALMEEGVLEEAIYFLGLAFQADPANPMIQLRLAQAFMRDRRHEAAAELLTHCATAAPDLAGLAALRAMNALAAGRPEEAVALARAAIDRQGPDAGLASVLAHALESAGRREEAAPAFRAAARLAPHDPYLAHLAATMAGETPEAATAGYVAKLFDSYAPRFEESLIALGYRVPGLVRRTVERLRPEAAAGDAPLGPVLDLGCGTGLVGVALLHLLSGGPLVGVDLSAGMLAQARAKGIYAALRHAEISQDMAQDPARYALVVAADVFCYVGRLDEVLALCRARLAPDGLLVFTVERGAPGSGYRLGAQGRYAHAPDHVAAVLAGAGLEAVEMREEDLRRDRGGAVPGLLVVARAAAWR
jgi:predicted TPR repeat methyltransferase